ncbi:MAG: bifunctional hydroxymethylpyrimidine kinase/phosphomethylpyrimidine kinase [Clostridia bacterium]|nr:bifunctional hydroxymethylpyrimidine kinase/phosphomethylpyrimidine kinase [Clostridia bacterium]MBQ6427126.1 bifunctional hydroxymethylpyrimidine kinase/phosphomethylpyrimidine kinase [Clostridia bacterium]
MKGHRDVLVIGGSTYDTTCVVLGEPIPKDSNPSRIYGGCGGVGRNIAENTARMGMHTALMTAFGTDAFSKEIAESCNRVGIDLSRSFVSENAGAGKYISIIDGEGELLLGASDLGLIEAVDPAYFTRDVRYLNSFSSLLVDANNTEEMLTAVAGAYKGRIFADAVSIKKAPRLRSVLNRLDTVKVNRGELAGLSGKPVGNDRQIREAAEYLISEGVHHVFVTKGTDGASCFDGETVYSVPSFPVNVVNATGAGDAFSAAVLYGSMRGYSSADTLLLGTAASHIALTSGYAVSGDMTEEHLLNTFRAFRKKK